ncbi:MAG: hypothetical protein GX442_17355 [Candidatus Riflebacteria bacterium]|nr:hypothetical protein [Candidatus Riflebacteria bacterium]
MFHLPGRGGRQRPAVSPVLLLAFLLVAGHAPAQSRTLVASGPWGAVATGHPAATRAALWALERGGNAVDAAVTAALVMGVVDPSNSGLGGDGYALLRHPSGETEAWDASIVPPAGSDPKPSRRARRSQIGLPTAPALLVHLQRRYGVLPFPDLVKPAIRLAKQGFRVSAYLERILEGALPRLAEPTEPGQEGPQFRRDRKDETAAPCPAGEPAHRLDGGGHLGSVAPCPAGEPAHRLDGGGHLGSVAPCPAGEPAHRLGGGGHLGSAAPRPAGEPAVPGSARPPGSHDGPGETPVARPAAGALALALARFAPEGRPLRAGEILRQPELAATLEALSVAGEDAFRQGPLAAALVADMRARGSAYTASDLAGYAPRRVPPQRLFLGDWELVGPPPPSSALVVMGLARELWQRGLPDPAGRGAETLRLLVRGLDLKYHFLAGCLRQPRRFLALLQAPPRQPPTDLPGDALSGRDETTHLVTWDRDGRIVSMTLTLGRHFGTGQLSPLGFFYNNEMNNFTPTISKYPADYPPDAGPISAKAPILVLKYGEPVTALGGAGSNRIVTNLAVILARYLRGDADLAALIQAPRLAPGEPGGPVAEWSPPGFQPAFPTAGLASLTVRPAGGDLFGLVTGIERVGRSLVAVGDYRRDGAAGALAREPPAPPLRLRPPPRTADGGGGPRGTAFRRSANPDLPGRKP